VIFLDLRGPENPGNKIQDFPRGVGTVYDTTHTPLFLTAFASAKTIPVAGFSLMISHDVFSGARITATAIGLPVRRSLDC